MIIIQNEKMIKQIIKSRKNYIWLLITFVLWPIVDYLLSLRDINLNIVRYILYTIGTFYILKLYLARDKRNKKLSALPKIILLFVLVWLVIRFVLSSLEIVDPSENYKTLKRLLSGDFLLFFSFFLVTITMPLQHFKIFLKTSYILSIIFLIVGIPLFGFFTSNILNQAELFVKYFYLGAIFLLLLFPYQKTKVNIIVALGFVLATLMMLLLARRNVVLYVGSAIFFLSLVILFSNSRVFKKRKPLLIAGSIVFGLCALITVFILQFNFDFFLERADTGFDEREGLFEEFNMDFNSNSIDWLIGRGPFGTFQSSLGDKITGVRNVIENGYLYYILQKGYFFLIPFIILSVIAIFNGFFKSKNYLSKASAILIIVNLIDMIGYGLPFLGLKYLNVLIAFGFCFSPKIRNMDDLEIRKLIRL